MKIRIALTGPESSGKTTLCKLLSEYYGCPWVSEFARDYLTANPGNYGLSDLDYMAAQQVERWERLTEENLVFYDTEMTVFAIWAKVKFGTVTETIHQLHAQQHIDHYFLCQPDIPWEFDPLRENPTDREALFTRYYETLKERQIPFTVVSGTIEERMISAQKVINTLLLKH